MAASASASRETFAQQLSALPDDVKAPLLEFDLALREVEEQVGELTSRDWAEMTQGASPLDVARLNVTSAYTLNTLFFIYLKTQGLPTTDHPVKQELDRVRQHLKKVKTVAGQVEEERANSRLNADAARRFITHALADPVQPSGADEGAAADGASATPDRGQSSGKKHKAGSGSEHKSGKKSKKK
jgi:exosome complex protein LRP1